MFGRGEERRIGGWAAWLGGAAALAVALSRGWAVGVALAVGVVLSLLNFSWLVAGAYALLPDHGDTRGRGGGVARFLLRFAVLAAVVYAIFVSRLLPVFPVILGLFAVPAATIGVGMRLIRTGR